MTTYIIRSIYSSFFVLFHRVLDLCQSFPLFFIFSNLLSSIIDEYPPYGINIDINEQDSPLGAGGVVSNDERNIRRWRLGQLGYIAEIALWMLVVNSVAHEEGGGGGGFGPPETERKKLHGELLDLFEGRLDERSALWDALVSDSYLYTLII